MADTHNELDWLYEDLRLHPSQSKKRQSSTHQRIRELKASGMETTTDPARNELDWLYKDLRLHSSRSKRRLSWTHQRIRELKAGGMEATTDPICSNKSCGTTVWSWGHECDSCAGREPF